MKKVEKRHLSKNTLTIIILASVLAVLITASVLVPIIVSALKKPQESEYPEIREDLGEALYINTPVAYPRLEEAEILSILVKNENGTFDLTRWPDDNGVFWMGYEDTSGNKEMLQYIPPIVDAEGDFDYESLYALELGDGYGTMYMLSYLCSAIGTPYFTERIDLPTGTDADSVDRREKLLKEYGLYGDELSRVSFAYGDRDSSGKITERGQHHIEIGSRALNGSGFYFRVDRRDCVYYTSVDYFEYALMGFNAFVKGMLVAEGLPGDSIYGPLLTTDFKQWVSTMHQDGVIAEGSNVAAKGEIILPIKESSSYAPSDYPNGYEVTVNEEYNIDLSGLRGNLNYDRIAKILRDKTVGDYSDSPLLITFLSELSKSEDMLINFGDNESLRYTYTVTAIESILNYENGGTFCESAEYGSVVAADSIIRVTYNYSIDGEAVNTVPRHAVIDLSSPAMSAASALIGKSVGTFEEGDEVQFDVVYTKENNSRSLTEEFVIVDIIGIYDKNGAVVGTIGDDSYVSIRYYNKINGVCGETKSLTVNIADLDDDAKWASLKTALLEIGEKKSGVNRVAYSGTYYYEDMRDFYTLIIDEIEFYVTSELIAAFRFCNASDRDPFYGESIYENTLEGKYSIYGLNANVCESVIKLLGGIGDTTNATEGLYGTTVAVGLSHKVMKEYGLYAYKIYFELPRSIYDASAGSDEDSDDALSDFAWHGTLGFTLYISEEDPETGKRYVGSDMYDLVAEVDADKFEFLEYSFVDFWARRSLVLIDAANLTDLELDFYMQDLYGEYDFDIKATTVYFGKDENGKVISSYEYWDGATSSQEKYYVYITEGEGSMETELSKYIDEYVTGEDKRVSITDLYNKVMGGGEELYLPNSIETVGVSNFALAFQVSQLTFYDGVLTEAEQQAAFERDKLMSMKFKIKGRNASPYYYVYDFYRAGDRKIMVSMYQMSDDGVTKTQAVSDFYISTYSFKKLVSAYICLFNAEEVDGNIPYPDEK